ncbi:PQQ-binding-like beta-propeller repeat protein [Streptomyces sp. NA04227]|nr:PQQ-binding-like beta-propeller repeat protein [Streptomyces sp. NA04227]
MPMVIGGVVVVALLATGGLVLAMSGDDDGGDGKGGGPGASGEQAKVLAKIPTPKVGTETVTMGMWVTEKNFVKGDVNKLVGYTPNGGSKQWEIPFGGQICWSSPHMTEDGKTAVLFKEGASEDSDCNQVGLVDLNKGELVWKKTAADPDGETIEFDEVTIGGGTVAAGGTYGDAAWSLDGKPLWKPKAYDAECTDAGYGGGGKKLVALKTCESGDSSSDSTWTVETVDPTTRQVTSSYAVPGTPEHVHVLATDPLVLGVDTGDAAAGTNVTDIVTVDDSAARGKVLSEIDVVAAGYEPECPGVNVEGCRELAIDKDKGLIYLASGVSGSYSGQIVTALDLKTGKKVGATQGTEEEAKKMELTDLAPVHVDKDGSVIVYQESKASEGGAVLRLDPKSFATEELMRSPDAVKEIEGDMFVYADRRIIFTGDRLYLGDDQADRPSADTDAKEGRQLALVLGTG